VPSSNKEERFPCSPTVIEEQRARPSQVLRQTAREYSAMRAAAPGCLCVLPAAAMVVKTDNLRYD